MLAEHLHKTVTELEDMPLAEFMDWMRYFEERNRKAEAEKGNLMAMDEDEMVTRLTGG
jgi:hypothetical protein